MSSILGRRSFLASSAVAACVGLGGRAAQAIEPITRPGRPKFKFSLAAYSYRQFLSGKNASLKLEDFIDDCAKMQLDGTELTGYYFPANPSSEYLLALKARCFRLGLNISGTAVGNNFCLPEGKERDAQIDSVKKWIDYAALMSAPVIRIFSGSTPKNSTEAEARRQAITAIEECCEYAGDKGVFLALENHGGLTATPAGMLELVKAVKSPWFGVNLDTGNFHGEDVYADLEQLASYALNVQVKVVVSPAKGKKQPADFARLEKMLTASGYRGYVVLEYEEAEDPKTACPRFVEELRAAFS